MKLHVSFDITDLTEALSIAQEVQASADILEVGSLLIYQNGIHAIREFKKNFQQKTILADVKIADRANEAVSLCADAGADWITVLAGTRRSIIHTACSTAHARGKKIMLDLIDASSLGQSALEAKDLGVDALLLHVTLEENATITFQDAWDMVHGNTSLPIFLTGTYNLATLDTLLDLNAAALVVGKEIVKSGTPAQAAEAFKLRITQGS